MMHSNSLGKTSNQTSHNVPGSTEGEVAVLGRCLPSKLLCMRHCGCSHAILVEPNGKTQRKQDTENEYSHCRGAHLCFLGCPDTRPRVGARQVTSSKGGYDRMLEGKWCLLLTRQAMASSGAPALLADVLAPGQGRGQRSKVPRAQIIHGQTSAENVQGSRN